MSDMKKIKCSCSMENSENYTTTGLRHHILEITDENMEIFTLMYFVEIFDFRQIIVFVRSAVRAEALSMILHEQGFDDTTTVHMKMPKIMRDILLRKFNEDDCTSKILVTTCCKHGMNFNNVDIIINFDEVNSPSEYIHRVCSKKQRKGLVVSFFRQTKYRKVLEEVGRIYKISMTLLPTSISTDTYMLTSNGSPEQGSTRNLRELGQI